MTIFYLSSSAQCCRSQSVEATGEGEMKVAGEVLPLFFNYLGYCSRPYVSGECYHVLRLRYSDWLVGPLAFAFRRVAVERSISSFQSV